MRSLVRPIALALAVLPLASSTLSAQRGRLTVTPLAGRALTGTVFEHHFYAAEYGGTEEYTRGRRLTLGDADVLGARIAVGVGRGWTAAAEGSYGRTSLRYEEWKDYPCLGYCMAVAQSPYTLRGDASVAALALSVERNFALEEDGLEIGAAVGGTLQRLGLERPAPPCGPSPTGTVCGPEPAWDSRYWVPGVGGSLALRFPITRWLGIEARGALSVGRANMPEFRSGEVFDRVVGAEPVAGEPLPPAQQRVRTKTFALGLSFRP